MHPNIIEFIGATSSRSCMIVTARHGHTLRYYIQKVKKENENSKKPSDFLFEEENDESTNSDKDKVLHFYRSVSVKSTNIQYCIDFMERICEDINEIIIFRYEAVRIRTLLCGYILALKKSNIGKNSDEEQFEIATDVSNLMDALQLLSIGIKNITSPTW